MNYTSFLPAVAGIAQGIGTYLGGRAAAKSADKAAKLQQQRWNEAKGYAEPYIEGGQRSFDLYNTATGANGLDAQRGYYNTFQEDPGFNSSVQYGLDQANARAAAQGQTLSGNTLAALQDYAENGRLGAYYRRLDDLYRGAQTGAAASGNLVSASTSSANNQGNFMLNEGKANAQTYGTLGNIPRNTLTDFYDQRRAA